MGFYGRLEDCSSMEAEMWGIARALKMLREQGISNVDVDSDSETMINMIKSASNSRSPHRNTIEDCKAVLLEMNGSLNHTLRQGNMVWQISWPT